jgi:hypothetical protein
LDRADKRKFSSGNGSTALHTQNDNYTPRLGKRELFRSNTIIIMVMEEFMVYLRAN